MSTLSEKITNLINTLFVSEDQKQELLSKVGAEGVNEELLIKLRDIIDDSVKEYEGELTHTLSEIQSQHAQEQQERVQAEEAEMEKLRKTIENS